QGRPKASSRARRDPFQRPGAAYQASSYDICRRHTSIQPGGRRRSEVEDEPRMVFDPFENLGVLVSGIVIDDHMHRFLIDYPGVDDLEEADELLTAMTLHALADDLAMKHIERREEGGDAVPLIVVGDGTGTTFLHRQPRLRAVQRLDLAHMGICGSRCSDR